MVIGGNGVGKTTFVNAILFALLGNAEYDVQNPAGKTERVPVVPSDFFKGRVIPEDENDAKVTLSFSIGRNQIEIARALFRPKILLLKINGKSFSGTRDKEELYRRQLSKLMKFDDFEHFTFVAANLLVFDEARHTLIWDPERQNRVIRLLFLTEFHGELSSLSERVTTLDTTSRHKSETRKDIRRNITRWVDSQKDAPGLSASAKRLAVDLAQLEQGLEDTETEISSIESNIEEETEHLQQLLADADQLEVEKLLGAKELQRTEAKFYAGIYDALPPEFLVVLQTLMNQGLCQVCGASHEKLKELGKKLKHEGKCLVCRSPLNYSVEAKPESIGDKLAADINRLREHLDNLEHKQRASVDAQAVANFQVSSLQQKLSKLLKRKKSDDVRAGELRIQVQKLAGNDGSEEAWLRKQKEEIDKLTREIDELNKKRATVLESLKRVNYEFTNRLAKVNDNLTPLFSQFASKFLGVECELVVGTMSRSRKPISYMYPRFGGKDRNDISEVSESQRFFIDQAFRMALITLFSKLNRGTTTFFVVETPEGSLDLAYERNVAEMYLDFAKRGHAIIVTSNLNSSNFLQGLYSHLGTARTKQTRTLDLLEHGRLSDVQGSDHMLAEFNKRRRQLGITSVR